MDEYGVVKKVERVTNELPQESSTTEVEKTIDGVVKRTVNRNMPDRHDDSAASLGIGDSVRNELTNGGAWNQVITESLPDPAGDLGADCDQTHLVHTHGETTGEGSEKPEEELGEPTLGEVETLKLERTRVGAWKMTKTKRIAKPQIVRLEWTDKMISVSKTMKTTTTYRNKYVSFRNQTAVPDYVPGQGFPGWDTCSPSVQINEFGLYDGVLHMRLYLDFQVDEEATSGSGSGPSEQGDEWNWVYTSIWRGSGDTAERKDIKAKKRILWSTRTNMLLEVAHGKTRPDYGLVSRLCGWYAEIYSEIWSTDWLKKDETGEYKNGPNG